MRLALTDLATARSSYLRTGVYRLTPIHPRLYLVAKSTATVSTCVNSTLSRDLFRRLNSFRARNDSHSVTIQDVESTKSELVENY